MMTYLRVVTAGDVKRKGLKDMERENESERERERERKKGVFGMMNCFFVMKAKDRKKEGKTKRE